MKYSIYPDAEWMYPDSFLSQDTTISLDTAIGGHAGVQLLGETLSKGTPLSLSFVWENDNGPLLSIYELLPVGVNENTAATLMTTTNYEECCDYVTKQAPFYVYDALRPYDGTYQGERLALYLCVEASAKMSSGSYQGTLSICYDQEITKIPIEVKVHPCKVPSLEDSRLGMLNFLYYEGIAQQHGIEVESDAYWECFRQYIRSMLKMRCTHIMLPVGVPVYDSGKLTGFDFSMAERAGRIALEEGAPYLCGGSLAHWKEWNESEYYLVWNSSLGVTTREGYLELRTYLTTWAEVAEKNGFTKHLSQSLADEPQVHNAGTYRILAAIFRKFLPGVPIIEAVETTDLGGGIDIWVPKQDTYEKFREDFDLYKAAGETMWFYTCAFPAGKIMNRSMDLPLTVSRLVLWMGAYYRLSGFLHWGYNFYIGEDLWNSACCPHKGALLPAGDAHIVYPGENCPYESMRYEAQRSGAEEYELLMELAEKAPELADALIQKVCTSFRDYTRSGQEVINVRKELFAQLDLLDC